MENQNIGLIAVVVVGLALLAWAVTTSWTPASDPVVETPPATEESSSPAPEKDTNTITRENLGGQ